MSRHSITLLAHTAHRFIDLLPARPDKHLNFVCEAWPMMKIVRYDDLKTVPWRNGRGETKEVSDIICDGVHHRLSIADIAVDGAFSEFPNCYRQFMIIGEHGVILNFADETHRVDPGHRLGFPGEDSPTCRLVDAPTKALNLISMSPRPALYLQPCVASERSKSGPVKCLIALENGTVPGGAQINKFDTIVFDQALPSADAEAFKSNCRAVAIIESSL